MGTASEVTTLWRYRNWVLLLLLLLLVTLLELTKSLPTSILTAVLQVHLSQPVSPWFPFSSYSTSELLETSGAMFLPAR